MKKTRKMRKLQEKASNHRCPPSTLPCRGPAFPLRHLSASSLRQVSPETRIPAAVVLSSKPARLSECRSADPLSEGVLAPSLEASRGESEQTPNLFLPDHTSTMRSVLHRPEHEKQHFSLGPLVMRDSDQLHHTLSSC